MLIRCFFPLCVFAVSCVTAQAVTLDWSTATYVNGSLTGSFDVDPAKPGNDITITISGDTSRLVPDPSISGNPPTPAIGSAFQGGQATIPNTLDLAVDFTNTIQQITVTVTFSSAYTEGVKNVSFSLFDVDLNNGDGAVYVDEIRSITATKLVGGTTIGATVTGAANNAVTGSGTVNAKVDGTISTADTGTGSGKANSTINFGGNIITSFTFSYGEGPGIPGLTDPTFQHIGLYNINFSPVPESNPALVSGLSCATAVLLVLWHGARRRKKRL